MMTIKYKNTTSQFVKKVVTHHEIYIYIYIYIYIKECFNTILLFFFII